MKRISLIIIAAVVLAFVACGSKQISTRVLCYNVHNCVGLDGELSCERIAKIINDADADGSQSRQSTRVISSITRRASYVANRLWQ